MYKTDVTNSNFRSIFYHNLPHKPYCADEMPGYLDIRPKEQAIKRRLLQVNPPCLVANLVFDIDRSDAFFAWSDANLPQPNWISKNRVNGHAHIGYVLETPVCITNSAKQKIVRYLARIERAYTLKLQADLGYVGLITKNPLHQDWDNYIFDVKPYQLNYLADFVDLQLIPKKQIEASGIGRNCTLFDITRHWAYSVIREFVNDSYERWEAEVLSYALKINTGFSTPLAYNEVKNTSRSISKWVWRNHDSTEFHKVFSAKQAFRGRMGGKASNSSNGGKARSQQYSDVRNEALKLHVLGFNPSQIAKKLNVSRPSIYKWIKNRPKV